jgi:peptidylprolyl isomerase
MRSLIRAALGLTMGLALIAAAGCSDNGGVGGSSDEVLVIELKTGKAKIKLRPDLAPKHVERVKQLAKDGFYDGLKFHRVIKGFMAQTGDPTGTGTGGSQYPDLPAEFSQEPYKRGTVGAARTADPNSANSQFFICFDDTGCSSLTGQYTVWGEVVEGMQHIDQVAPGEPPPIPDVMQRVYLESDAS